MLTGPVVSYANAYGLTSLHRCITMLTVLPAPPNVLPVSLMLLKHPMVPLCDSCLGTVGRCSAPQMATSCCSLPEHGSRGQSHPPSLCQHPSLIKGVQRLPNTSWGDARGRSSVRCHSEILITNKHRIICLHISRVEAIYPDLCAMLAYQLYRWAASSLMKD